MAVRAERVVAAPHYAQGLRAKRASGRPLGAALRTFPEQQVRPMERLSQLLQIEDETAKGVAANEEVFHGKGSFARRIWAGAPDNCKCRQLRQYYYG